MGHTYSPESSLKYNLHILCLYFCGRKTFSYRNKTQPSFPLAFSHIKNQLWRISHSNSKTGYGTRSSGDAQEAFKNLLSFHISDYWSWRCTAEQLPEWGILNWIMWEMLWKSNKFLPCLPFCSVFNLSAKLSTKIQTSGLRIPCMFLYL